MAIVRSITSLGVNLGLRMTAEGVESAEHLAKVRKPGCTEAQELSAGLYTTSIRARFHVRR
jgi:EAL domain-containing protein (putative c-di-GMP-specific phosphodiesterase class I)